MKITPGEIYFIGEREHDTGQITPFYKIGIVRGRDDKRSSEERLREHQTGNPRPLFVYSNVKTEAVERVETLMHRRFAQSRVTGEWFRFDGPLLDEAVAITQQFSDEISEHIPFVMQAQDLAKEVSTGSPIAPDDEMLGWFNAYHASKVVVKTFKDLDQAVLGLLRAAVARGESPAGVKQQKIQNSEYFNLNRFKEEQPELYARYLSETIKFSQRFLVKTPKDKSILEIDSNLALIANNIGDQIQLVREGKASSDTLQPLRLIIFENVSNAEWNLEIAEAHLKSATGTSAGIEGLTTWTRENKTTVVFDENAFKGENFDIFRQYIDLKQTGGGLLVDAGQAAAE